MFLLVKPNKDRIDEFIVAQSLLEFTYPAVGATNNEDHPAGFTVDHNQVRLGSGQAVFDAARQALCKWEHFRLSWIELHCEGRAPEPEKAVAVLVRAFGLWALNACRIVYVDERECRFAFAYGTLPGHAESGEERFQVEWREDDSVWYDILAFSRPNQLFSRIGYPYVRRKQKQFARESMISMQSATR